MPIRVFVLLLVAVAITAAASIWTVTQLPLEPLSSSPALTGAGVVTLLALAVGLRWIVRR